MLRRLGLAALVATLALAPAASAGKKKTVKLAPKGATTLALSEGAAAALQSLGIAAAPLSPARAGDDGLRSRSPRASWTPRPTPGRSSTPAASRSPATAPASTCATS